MLYTIDGQEVTEDEFRALFGTFKIHPLPQGVSGYRVIELLGTGPVSASGVVHTVHDLMFEPVEGVTVCEHWPGAPPNPDEVPDNGLPEGMEAKSVSGKTNDVGAIGFGWGGGSYYWSPSDDDPDKPANAATQGPHAHWLAGVKSETIDGQGMLVDTTHQHYDIIWKWMVPDEPPPDPEPEPVDGPQVWADMPSMGYDRPTEVSSKLLAEWFGPVEVWISEPPAYEITEIVMREGDARLHPFTAVALKDGLPWPGVTFKCVCDDEIKSAITGEDGVVRFEDMGLYSAFNKGPCTVGIPGQGGGIDGVGTVKVVDGPNRYLDVVWSWNPGEPDEPTDLTVLMTMVQECLIRLTSLEVGLAEHEQKLAEHDERVTAIMPAIQEIIAILKEMQANG
jgi:hypothetical protein